MPAPLQQNLNTAKKIGNVALFSKLLQLKWQKLLNCGIWTSDLSYAIQSNNF